MNNKAESTDDFPKLCRGESSYFNLNETKDKGELPDIIVRCNAEIHRLIKKQSIKYLVCVDGSDSSDIAYSMMRSLLKASDTVSVFHAYREGRSSYPLYDKEAVYNKYKGQLLSDVQPRTRFDLAFVKRKKIVNAGNEAVLDVLIDHLDTYQSSWEKRADHEQPPDFVVLGRTGRKCSTPSKTSLGSNADLALRTVHVPCIIAKRHIPSGPRKFLYFVSDNLCSKIGFDILKQLIRCNDTLIIANVANKTLAEETQEDRDKKNDLENYFENVLDYHGPRKCRFMTIPMVDDKSEKELMVQYVLEEVDVDFMALAPRAKANLSSITEYVIGRVPCSVILCKI